MFTKRALAAMLPAIRRATHANRVTRVSSVALMRGVYKTSTMRFCAGAASAKSPVINKTMKAAVLHEHKGKIVIKEIDIPKPNADQVLIKIKSSGVCHTDVHARDGDWPVKSMLPLISGHEGAGQVVEIGSNVKNMVVGDRVGIPWLHQACGDCEWCCTGQENLCPNMACTGYTVDGCLSEYVLGEAHYVAKLPDGLSYEQAAPILCAGVTSYKALKCAHAKPGDYVGIIGAAGGLGHLCIQYAKYMGFKVVSIVRSADKAEFCQRLGSDFAVDIHDHPNGDDVFDHVHKITHGGCHGVICMATYAEGINDAVKYTRSGGHVVNVGLPAHNTMDLQIFDTVLRGISVVGSIVGTRQDLHEALDIAADGNIKCILEEHTLDEVNDVFEKVKNSQVNGRIVINM